VTELRWPLSTSLGFGVVALGGGLGTGLAVFEPVSLLLFVPLVLTGVLGTVYTRRWRLQLTLSGLTLRSWRTRFLGWEGLAAWPCALEQQRVVVVPAAQAQWWQLRSGGLMVRVPAGMDHGDALREALLARGCVRSHGRPRTAHDRWIDGVREATRGVHIGFVLVFVLGVASAVAFFAVDELSWARLTGNPSVDTGLIAATLIGVWWVGSIVLGGVRRANLLRDLSVTGMGTAAGLVVVACVLGAFAALFETGYGPGAAVALGLGAVMISWEARRTA
jgi:hypothetical protein